LFRRTLTVDAAVIVNKFSEAGLDHGLWRRSKVARLASPRSRRPHVRRSKGLGITRTGV
jgi:hypothetical protein